MAAAVQVFQYVEVTIKGRQIRMGSLQAAQVITLGDDAVLDRTNSIAHNTTWDVWVSSDTENEPMTDFDFLGVESDQDIYLELTTDDNGTQGAEQYVIEIKANIPWFLESDAGDSDYTADFAAGTIDVIDRIRVRNESGSTALIRVLMLT